MNLAQVVVQAGYLQPLGLGCDHAPTGQVVQRSAPQHGLFAAGVHGNVAADAGGLGRGRVNRKHMASALGGISHPLGHHAGLSPDRGHRLRQPGQGQELDLAHGFELFGVDDHAFPGQRDGAAGVAGATAARDDGQTQLDAALDQAGHLKLAVRREHHKRVLHAPVGGVGHVRDAAEAIKFDVVARRQAGQHPLGLATQRRHLNEGSVKRLYCSTGPSQKLADHGIPLGLDLGGTAFLHFGKAMVQGLHQQTPAPGVVQQIVLQVGVALHHPDVAQHLVQHAGRAASAALATQLKQMLPGPAAQQTDHDLPVREGCVVVGDFPNAHVRLRQTTEGGPQVLHR